MRTYRRDLNLTGRSRQAGGRVRGVLGSRCPKTRLWRFRCQQEPALQQTSNAGRLGDPAKEGEGTCHWASPPWCLRVLTLHLQCQPEKPIPWVPLARKVAIPLPMPRPVSYTHMTLPTNREV